jgi:hypothetical protein
MSVFAISLLVLACPLGTEPAFVRFSPSGLFVLADGIRDTRTFEPLPAVVAGPGARFRLRPDGDYQWGNGDTLVDRLSATRFEALAPSGARAPLPALPYEVDEWMTTASGIVAMVDRGGSYAMAVLCPVSQNWSMQPYGYDPGIWTAHHSSDGYAIFRGVGVGEVVWWAAGRVGRLTRLRVHPDELSPSRDIAINSEGVLCVGFRDEMLFFSLCGQLLSRRPGQFSRVIARGNAFYGLGDTPSSGMFGPFDIVRFGPDPGADRVVGVAPSVVYDVDHVRQKIAVWENDRIVVRDFASGERACVASHRHSGTLAYVLGWWR